MTDAQTAPPAASASDDAVIETLDIGQIMRLLPHRYPFLLIDRVTELVRDRRVTAIKNVTMNEQFFQGHFPGFPVMPGVLIIEAMAQTGGTLVMISAPPERQGKPVLFMGIDKAKFRKPVVPGDVLTLKIDILKKRQKVVKMAGVALVGDERVAEAELLASFGD